MLSFWVGVIAAAAALLTSWLGLSMPLAHAALQGLLPLG